MKHRTDSADPARRLDTHDWANAADDLNAAGWTVLPNLFSTAQCVSIQNLYGDQDLFRSKIIMSRHSFGRGEYQYFAYPLPSQIETLRRALYARLAPIANDWAMRLANGPFPADLKSQLARCHAAGQSRPTPLLLKYCVGDYNRLHQDLYGELQFPLQAAVLLSSPHADFDGGEFVLTEQRPRAQSRAAVIPLQQGDAVIFAVNERPAEGKRGVYRLKMRHGVSTVRAGARYVLGLIFHDAA